MKSQRTDHDELRAALQAVARSTSGEQAPDTLEQRLLSEFHGRLSNSNSIRSRNSIPWMALAAGFVVAATAALAWMILWNPGAVQPPAMHEKFAFELSAPPRLDPPVFAVKKSHPQPATSSEVVTSFLPLGFSSSPADAYQVVRVQLDRSSLLQFGLPVNAELADRPVDADLLVGNDGMPRAVRFVSRISSTSATIQNWRNQ